MSEIPPVAIGAILAALITGLVSLLGLIISKEHKVSEFRQAWIDSLRSELANLISHANAIHGADVATFESASETWKIVRDDFVGINQSAANIRLRLNPKEKEAQAVLGKIEALERLLTPGVAMDYAEMNRVEKELVAKAQVLLKNEWMRVRNGEAIYHYTKILAFSIVFGALLALVAFVIAKW
ncbi:hypothetical protein LX59_01791 [Azomonas agilis]|uniref:CHASE3 domain sensor protein n=1 Tax=Azomonas agilis TaxID=116849 RepID=A0A562ILD7_9GAMM|nr:hypothetical protein [Azomonas agilis]TWH71503.1 hypothetical protein LX59_01791 [Azomonas agilis]